MLNISIVDDETIFINNLINKISEFCEKMEMECTIDKYSNGYDLLENYKKYHIIFLDIDMPMINGIKVCENINKNKGVADIPYIIFLTSKDNMVFKALKQKPYTFLRKSELYDNVFDCISLIFSKLKNISNDYIIKSGRDFILLNLDDILYLEKEKNYVFFYSEQLAYKERSTMDEKYEDLNNKGFIRIHIGCIVNAKHISTFETNRVILDCGKEFIISKKYKDIAKKNYYDWLVKEYA